MRYRFFEHEQFNYETLLALGSAYRQAADPGEVLAAAERIVDGDAESWFTTWTELGRRVRDQADRSSGQGRQASAREACLRAAAYLATALVSIDGTADPGRLGSVFREHRECFEHFAAACDPPAEPVAIPYEGGLLPGYLFSPPGATEPLPTVIVNNGSDGPLTAVWALIGAGAVARGYRALLFDGPGQQSMLFQHGVPFRHDWEKVITPVVDFLLGREDVDGTRVALIGISQAGYWVPRALAFEHRIAAAVADPGIMDVSTSWWQHMPAEMHALWESGERETFDAFMREALKESAQAAVWAWRSKPYGIESPFDMFTEIGKYTLTPVVERITTPLLITDPEGESFWPGQSRQLYEALPGPKELVRFTEAEGANLHCEPLGRAVFEQRVFDWVDARLGTGKKVAAR